MAITNNTKLIGAIKNQHVSTSPGLGCGAILVPAGHPLPAGDYVMIKPWTSSGSTVLSNIVWKGEPWADATSSSYSGLTTITFDNRVIMEYEMNIESCDVTGSPALFYKRCK